MSDRMEKAANTAKELSDLQYALAEHESLGNVDCRIIATNSDSIENSWILLKSLWAKYPLSAGVYDAHLRHVSKVQPFSEYQSYDDRRAQAATLVVESATRTDRMSIEEDMRNERRILKMDKFGEIEAGMIQIMTDIVKGVTPKNREYNESWYKRGGVGAYMMLARKIDRLENYVQAHGFDIMAALAADTRPEGIIDDIQDLIGYLGLVLQKHKFGRTS